MKETITIEEIVKERENLKKEQEQLLKELSNSNAVILNETKISNDLLAKKKLIESKKKSQNEENDKEQIKYNEEQQKIMDARTARIEDEYSKMMGSKEVKKKIVVKKAQKEAEGTFYKDPDKNRPGDVIEMTGDNLETITKVNNENQEKEWWEDELLNNRNNETKEEKGVQSKDPDEIEKKKIVVKKVQKEIEDTFYEERKKKDDIEINAKLKIIGLSGDYFKDNESWQDFSKAEKLLILEQTSQDTLSKVREIGEQRFQEKNKINMSWKVSTWKPLSVGEKIWHKIGKSYWISNEEKEVLKEVENGTMKPDEKVLNSLIERQDDLGLEVKEINGKTYIEFQKNNKDLSKEEQAFIEKFNETANTFAKMPDSWKNERSAKSTDKWSSSKNHQKYEEIKVKYEKEKSLLIESKVKQYEAKGMSKSEAKEKAMLDTKDIDFQVEILQFTNTNPDALEELNKIKKESSWGRLVNNENMWRAGYMAAGYGARTAFHSTIGFLTAPITAGIIGGIRGRRKANENINKSFNEGRKEETYLERKEKGKKGLFDDKNKDQGALSYLLSGEKVNTKEVAAFIDADSQKQRIDNLVNKINNTKNSEEKILLMSQLEARLHYIELKQSQGLVNYGKENSIAKNYELFKTMSEAYVISTTIDNLGISLTREMKEDILERNSLLTSVMNRNEEAFGKEIASHKNAEMLRGALVGAGFATLGGLIRDWMHHDQIQEAIVPAGATSHGVDAVSGPDIKPIQHIIEHAKVEAVADNGQGAISTLRELQNNLKVEYPDLSKAPESVRHILGTDAHKLAQEYGMYKPGSDAESAFLKSGDKFTVDETGNVKFGESLLEKGNEIKANNLYEGKMFDSDHSGEVHESFKVPEQVNPETGEPLHEMIQTEGEQINPENGQLMHPLIENQQVNPEDANNFKTPEQVDPATGKPLHVIDETDKTNTETITVEPSYTKEVIWNYSENLNHIFPTEKAMDTWHYINNNIKADRFMEMSKNGEITDAYKPLVNYINKLKDISGIRPEGETLINKAESISSYIVRATKKVAELGKLDKVKL